MQAWAYFPKEAPTPEGPSVGPGARLSSSGIARGVERPQPLTDRGLCRKQTQPRPSLQESKGVWVPLTAHRIRPSFPQHQAGCPSWDGQSWPQQRADGTGLPGGENEDGETGGKE